MGEVHIKRDFRFPAAIQFKNPGAMWPGAVATKWGSTKWQYLSDGTGQGGGGHGNKIAIFDNWVDGISAQLDLWRSSKNYKNKTLRAALRIWSGGNSPEEYVKHVVRKIPTMTGDTVMNEAFWRSPDGMKFLRVQAEHEAGKVIPATDADYKAAQERVMKGIKPTLDTVTKAGKSIVVGTAGGGTSGTAGLPLHWALAIGLGIALVVFLVWYFKPRDPSVEVSQTLVIPPFDPTPIPVEAIDTEATQ